MWRKQEAPAGFQCSNSAEGGENPPGWFLQRCLCHASRLGLDLPVGGLSWDWGGPCPYIEIEEVHLGLSQDSKPAEWEAEIHSRLQGGGGTCYSDGSRNQWGVVSGGWFNRTHGGGGDAAIKAIMKAGRLGRARTGKLRETIYSRNGGKKYSNGVGKKPHWHTLQ